MPIYMLKYSIIFLLIFFSEISFSQIVLTQNHNDAAIGLDRKAFVGIGNTSQHSDGYAHDFTLPTSTNPCQKIVGIAVNIVLITG